MMFVVKSVLCVMFFVQSVSGQWVKDTNSTISIQHIEHIGNKLIASDEGSFSSYQLLDGSTTWDTITAGSLGSFTYGMVSIDSLQWIATEQGFYYSTVSRSAWTLYGDTVLHSGKYYFPISIAVLPPKIPGQPYRLFGGTLGIGLHASTDGGMSWYEIDSARFHNDDVLDLQMAQTAADSVEFFMVNLSGISFSADLGDTWVRDDSADVQGFTPYHLVHVANDWFALSQQGIFKRDKSSGIWKQCTDILGNQIVFGSATAGEALFLAVRNQGIYRSSDAGSTWALADSFSVANFDFTGLTTDGTQLYAATGVEGLWHIPISSLGVTSVKNDGKNLPSKIFLSQNYPNPFNPTTQISYTIPKASNVSITIYDILGQQITTLVNGKNEPGEHFVNWNALNVPSGVYFYRIAAGDFIQTKKMVLMK